MSFTGELRREEVVAVVTPASPKPNAENVGIYPRQVENRAELAIWWRKRTVPPLRPPRHSLVTRDPNCERREIVPAKRLLSWPPCTLEPRTVPLPGNAETTPFRKSGVESYLS